MAHYVSVVTHPGTARRLMVVYCVQRREGPALRAGNGFNDM